MTVRIAVDFESTGLNPMQNEIITGYFLKENGEDYHFKSQVDKWGIEAEFVHGITQNDCIDYPDKDTAMKDLIAWLPKEFEMVVYANPRTQLGYMLYDVVLLKCAMMDYLKVDRENHLPFNIRPFSVHQLAKDCAADNLFNPTVNPNTNRKSFSQINVYKALFDGELYNAHCAETDVKAMARIYDKLKHLKDNNISIAKIDQLSLI